MCTKIFGWTEAKCRSHSTDQLLSIHVGNNRVDSSSNPALASSGRHGVSFRVCDNRNPVGIFMFFILLGHLHGLGFRSGTDERGLACV